MMTPPPLDADLVLSCPAKNKSLGCKPKYNNKQTIKRIIHTNNLLVIVCSEHPNRWAAPRSSATTT